MINKQNQSTGGTVSDAGIAAVFAVPIYLKRQAVLDSDIVALRQLAVNHTQKLSSVEYYGAMSKNSYLLNEPNCVELKNKIKNFVQEYAYCYLGFQGQFEITQSWVSVKAPGQEHHPHSHANSIVSGILYFDNDGDCEPINFLRPGYNANLAHYTMTPIRNEINNEFTFTQVSFSVENYMLVLFPSYLMHFVNINKSNVNRYSMAFNAVPKYSLGNQEQLTELNFSHLGKD